MSRRNSESVVCEFDSLCPGVCLKSLTARKKKKIKEELSRRVKEQALHQDTEGKYQISFLVHNKFHLLEKKRKCLFSRN